ncbi:FAD/NAD(P)-binding domain-containing protein [Lophiostoma macrostomum CBS 122681]|uniref:FAD/NAD(P)-binding domain-containing protein n=1 Tax=Lophiostoma macrostomum CBS 122681 TaxID=1314788 RepID=A0A6A6SVL4_9PLEO|nr:FAD/NAD(P)-binding domain-containing protein [Lophiostoma macrostomum CBS 122681]
MKTVAIIGSGPCGIIAARKFLQSPHHYSVTIFEKNAGIGGLWRPGGPINPEMRTNQTKFTVAFSDLAWETALGEEDGNNGEGEGEIPVYPKAWQVYRYLEEYVKRYIPDSVFRFNTTVVRTEKISSSELGAKSAEQEKWKITTKPTFHAENQDRDQQETEHTFDLVVIAPGAFSSPGKPPFDIDDGLAQDANSRIPILHSTSYRSLTDILPNDNPDPSRSTPENILVVGGSHSGVEIASLIALQLSSAKWTPSSPRSAPIPKDIKITHITSHPLFALPGIVRDPTSKTITFQPIDFLLFNRSNRPAQPAPSFTYGLWNEEKSRATREMGNAMMNGGNRAGEYGNGEGQGKTGVKEALPIGVLGDTYPQFVASGVIKPILGHLTAVKKVSNSNSTSGESTATGTIRLSDGQGEHHVEKVIAVIDATGFSTTTPLNMLSPAIKTAIGFSDCSRAPVHLTTSCLTQHPSLPSLGIMGYQGAHWGVFEMQARTLAHRWLRSPIPELSEEEQGEAENIGRYIDELREAVRQKRRWQVPQNPFGDYLGLLEKGARNLGLQKLNLGCTKTSGLVCAARFIDRGSGSEVAKGEAFKSMSSLESVTNRGKEEGLFIARAAFHGLLGEWISAHRDAAGQVRTVQWSFHPRLPTDSKFGWEYLVVGKDGGCRDEEGLRWVYRYDETLDDFSIWSVDTRDKLTVGRKLYSLSFSRTERHGKDTAVASRVGDAVEGGVDGEFRFMFAGVSLETFTLETRSAGGSSTCKQFVRIETRQ